MIEVAPWGLVESLVHVDGGPPGILDEAVRRHGPEAVVEVLVAELRGRVDHRPGVGTVSVLLEIGWADTVFRHRLDFEDGRVTARPATGDAADVVLRWSVEDLTRRLFPVADRPDRIGWDYEPVWADRMRAELAAVRAGERDMTDVQRDFDDTVAVISRASHLIRSATAGGAGTLDELAVRFGSDKYGHHHWYTPHYDTHLRHLREQPVRILEIGIGGYQDQDSGGESLRMWEQYFRRGLVYGLDITQKKGVDSTRIRTVVGDQSDPGQLDRLGRELGPFDVIIDDGSHVNAHVTTSFRALFPYLRDEGYYVVEDTQTAYWPAFGGTPEGSASATTSLGFLTGLVDGLNHREYRSGEDQQPVGYEGTVAALHFYHNMAFVQKAVNAENGWPVWARGPMPGQS